MSRSEVLKKNISLGMIYKIIGMILSYITIPVVLNYLGEENYGVWVTVFAIVAWINNFDIGIGSGLRFNLTKSLSEKNELLAKEYITTSYVIISIITLIMFILGTVGISFLNFQDILNVNFIDESILIKVFFTLFIFTLSNFVIGLFKQLYMSIHETAFVGMTTVFYQGLTIILILIVSDVWEPSLYILAFIYGGANLLTGIVFTLVFFYKKPSLKPNFASFNRKLISKISGLGLEFFTIKICTIVIFTTDNLIISNVLGPKEVTPYSVVYQMFQVFIIFWYLVSSPLTPLYTEAFYKKDFKWIRSTFRKLNLFFCLIAITILGFVFIVPFILNIWLGKELIYPKFIFSFFGMFVLIRIYGDLYMSFLNGIGKLRLQLYLSIFGAVINIPLSLYFISSLNLGSSGVILATCISLLALALIMPYQAYHTLPKGVDIENS